MIDTYSSIGAMYRLHRVALLSLWLFASLLSPIGYAEDSPNQALSEADRWLESALSAAHNNDLNQAKQQYQHFNEKWLVFEDSIKSRSGQAYKDIESKMGKVTYAFLKNQQDAVIKALGALQQVNQSFLQGHYRSDVAFEQKDLTLKDFLGLLSIAQQAIEHQQTQKATTAIANVRDSWLSVEGVVVAQSASVYNASERDMVTIDAMVQEGNFSDANKLIQQMNDYLTPLADKSAYTMWDAAMIPIREGLEALLVVGALLAYTNKAEKKKGNGWIWSGVAFGLAVSAALAVAIKLIFSTAAFSHNNFLIGGFTGVFAAVMLLYMSYWLHSKSNVAEWNRYIASKSANALATGRLASLGFLAFLAVFREGTETVLFIVGMINQISVQDLIMGILIGCAVLAIVAYFMLFVGMKMPIRAFFMISSLIVLYLCIKFTGLGIHSLQLAGWLPSTHMKGFPSIDFFGFYPSLESALPQCLIVLAAIIAVLRNTFKSSATATQKLEEKVQ